MIKVQNSRIWDGNLVDHENDFYLMYDVKVLGGWLKTLPKK